MHPEFLILKYSLVIIYLDICNCVMVFNSNLNFSLQLKWLPTLIQQKELGFPALFKIMWKI